MKQLTKLQKLKVLDRMIVTIRNNQGLCILYDQTLEDLNYNIDSYELILYWTPRFKELDKIIEAELIRTGGIKPGGSVHINYPNWVKDRVKLLKKVKKQIKVK